MTVLLQRCYTNSDFVNSLAVGGETGTLQDEMNGTAAQGNCRGKTGTLHDVANLAGYCRARDGHTLAFAFLANGIGDPNYVHAIEGNDMAVALAATTARLDERLAPSSSRRPASSSTATPSRSACASFDPGLSPATT